MYQFSAKTIIFISGPFTSHYYWEEWLRLFESGGYKVLAPPWLHKNDTAENLNTQDTCNKVGSITLPDLLRYYTEIIEILQEKPILIGHSYGGLLVQLLVQKDLAFAGICINSFPPSGFTYSKLLYYKSLLNFFPPLFSKKNTCTLPFKTWEKVFYNTGTIKEQTAIYNKFVIPESKKVLWDLIFSNTGVDFKRKHAPLFFISGTEDQIVSTDLSYWNFKKYRNFHSITCFRKMNDQGHFLILEPDWRDTAEYILKWLGKIH
jgi:pimeloyl-ACP methyl ester carboxylesterase